MPINVANKSYAFGFIALKCKNIDQCSIDVLMNYGTFMQFNNCSLFRQQNHFAWHINAFPFLIVHTAQVFCLT